MLKALSLAVDAGNRAGEITNWKKNSELEVLISQGICFNAAPERQEPIPQRESPSLSSNQTFFLPYPFHKLAVGMFVMVKGQRNRVYGVSFSSASRFGQKQNILLLRRMETLYGNRYVIPTYFWDSSLSRIGGSCRTLSINKRALI